jgi:hypothetical protein
MTLEDKRGKGSVPVLEVVPVDEVVLALQKEVSELEANPSLPYRQIFEKKATVLMMYLKPNTPDGEIFAIMPERKSEKKSNTDETEGEQQIASEEGIKKKPLRKNKLELCGIKSGLNIECPKILSILTEQMEDERQITYSMTKSICSINGQIELRINETINGQEQKGRTIIFSDEKIRKICNGELSEDNDERDAQLEVLGLLFSVESLYNNKEGIKVDLDKLDRQ